jgi:hypothetical protein
MDAKAALAERMELFNNAMNFRPNQRTPMFANFFTWKYVAEGYNLNIALRDYDILEKVNREFHERYQFDCYMDKGTRNPLRVTDAFGGRFHYVDAKGEAVIADDRCLIEADEYQELIANPAQFYWTKAFKRYSKTGLTLAEFRHGVEEFLAFGAYTAKLDDVFLNEYGTVSVASSSRFAMLPFEYLFNFLRGIKPLALDVRKHKTELMEVSEGLWQTTCEPGLQAAMTSETDNAITSVVLAFLAHSILSSQQFEEIYWPYVKRTIDAAIANNKRIFVFCESEMLRFAEFFEDVPKGVLFIHPEQDDIFEYRKRLPNITIAGGMPTHLLGRGSQQECIDYAKRLIDELGEGYVFSTNKMMSFKEDATRATLLAVTDFVRSYTP